MESPRSNLRFYKRGILFLAILVAVGIECNTAFAKNAAIGYMFGDLSVPCAYWPPLETARRILSEHSDVVRQLHDVPGSRIEKLFISERDGLGWISKKCPSRGILIIQTYANRLEMQVMREIIGDEQYFFGVPYVMFDS